MSILHHRAPTTALGDILPSNAPELQPDNQASHILKEWAKKHRRAVAAVGGGVGVAAASAAIALSPHTEVIQGTASPEPGHSVAPKPGVAPPVTGQRAPSTEKALVPADKNLCNVITFPQLNEWLTLGIPGSMVNDVQVACNEVPNRRGFVAYGEWRPDPNSVASQYDSITVAVDNDLATDGGSNFERMKQEEPRHKDVLVGGLRATRYPYENRLVVQVPGGDGYKDVSIQITPVEGIGSSDDVKTAINDHEVLGAAPIIAAALPGVNHY